MKPLYVLNGDDVRSRRASPGEIQEFIDDPRTASAYSRLGTVTVDANGEIVATPLTEQELRELAANHQADQAARLRKLLDEGLAFHRSCAHVRGVLRSERFTIWAEDAPHAEDVVRDWAEEHGLRVTDDPRPAKSEHWIRTMHVADGSGYDSDIVKIQWPSVRVGADMMIVEGVELMSQSIAKLGVAATAEDQEPF